MSTTASSPVPRIELPLEDGWTLPASWYTDLGVHERERERLFARAWTYAGPAEWVSEPGSYFAAHIGHVPVAVVRGTDGTLRGLVNVCRHRGHLVVDGTGCRETLQCPYHAWTYDLDGTPPPCAPRRARAGLQPGGAVARAGLRRTRGGRSSSSTPTPSPRRSRQRSATSPRSSLESGLDVGAIRFHSHHEWPIEANWKIVLENFLECYHCPTAHPGFSKVIDVSPDAYALSVHATFSSQVGPGPRSRRSPGNGKAAYTPRGDVVQAQYHFLFPSTTINIAPGIPNVSMERYNPDGLRRTIEVTDYYFGADVSDEEIDELVAWDTQVAEEDVSLVQSVQRGLESAMVPQGRLMSPSEQLIADFQRRVHDALI